VHHTLIHVEVSFRPRLARLEVGAERGYDDAAPGPRRLGHPSQHERVVFAHESEAPLTDRDDRVELVVERHLTRVDLEESRTDARVASRLRRELQEARGDVYAGDGEARSGQGDGVPAGTTPDVQHARTFRQCEEVEQEAHLLIGPLREAVTEIRGTELLADRSEVRVAGVAGRISHRSCSSWALVRRAHLPA
jgi:hypothetical protein